MKREDFIIFESVLLLHILVSMRENKLRGTRHGIMKHFLGIIYFTLFQGLSPSLSLEGCGTLLETMPSAVCRMWSLVLKYLL